MKLLSLLLALTMSINMISCNSSEEELLKIPKNNGNSNGENTGSNNDENMELIITIGTTSFTVTLADNSTAKAFKELLPLSLEMKDFNSNEKVTNLPQSLPVNSYRPGTINTGDIMLYGSSSIVIFYETFSSSYSYSRIAFIEDTTGLKAALGSENVTVTFQMKKED